MTGSAAGITLTLALALALAASLSPSPDPYPSPNPYASPNPNQGDAAGSDLVDGRWLAHNRQRRGADLRRPQSGLCEQLVCWLSVVTVKAVIIIDIIERRTGASSLQVPVCEKCCILIHARPRPLFTHTLTFQARFRAPAIGPPTWSPNLVVRGLGRAFLCLSVCLSVSVDGAPSRRKTWL